MFTSKQRSLKHIATSDIGQKGPSYEGEPQNLYIYFEIFLLVKKTRKECFQYEI